MLPGEAADEPDLAWPYRHPELPWLWTHWRTSIRACVCVCLLYAQKKQLQQYASHCLLRLQFRYGRCCCLFRMQFYGQRTPCIPLPASLVSSTSYVVATASASSRHILTPQKYATRAFCLLKILHFAFCSAKLIWSAFLPAFAMDSVLVDWSGHHFNYNGHLRPHPDPHLAVLIQALDRNQAWVRAGFGFYCIRINNCIGHKCGGRGWDSSIAIIYISLGQQQKATQHALNKLAKLAMCFGMSVCLSVCVSLSDCECECVCVCVILCAIILLALHNFIIYLIWICDSLWLTKIFEIFTQIPKMLLPLRLLLLFLLLLLPVSQQFFLCCLGWCWSCCMHVNKWTRPFAWLTWPLFKCRCFDFYLNAFRKHLHICCEGRLKTKRAEMQDIQIS